MEAAKTALTRKNGDVFYLGSAEITILLCWPEAWDENDMSIILKVDYGKTSFLFTGDAGYMAEYMVIDGGLPLRANVLKVGHHGSISSSTGEFLDAVDPVYAVISCEKNNPYGHPRTETLEALERKNITIYRTDQSGSIHFHSDGENLTVSVERKTQ